VNCDVDGATVTIVQNGEIIGKSFAAGGMATVTFTALVSDQPLVVTAVKQNYKPYQGVITVANGPSGLEDLLFSQLSVYPNPANDFVYLNWNEGLTVEGVRLYDLSGKFLMDAEVTGHGATLNTAALSSGMYVVEVHTAGHAKTYRVAVQ
jgi:gingipain R